MSYERLSELLDRWEESRNSGSPVAVAELCRDCPELVPQLEKHIKALEGTDWLEHSLKEETATWSAPSIKRPAVDFGLPEQLGGIRLDEVIGMGGFGQVWRGYDTELQRTVAVKVCRPDRVQGDFETQELLREARRAAQLKHPGIVPIYELDREGDYLYIVYAYLPGGDLASRVSQGPLPIAQALPMAIAICESLHYAHESGLIHRDIKPANILLDELGRPHLTDFGISATRQEARKGLPVSGTLYYMSPEQLEGREGSADARTDIFSVGVVLIELFTGKRPFDGRSPLAVRRAILDGQPKFRETPEPLPPRVVEICKKCLASKPDERYATAKELADELRTVYEEIVPPPVKPREQAWSWGRTWILGTVLGLTMLGVVLGVERFLEWRHQAIVRENWGSPAAQRVVAEIVLRNFGTIKIKGLDDHIIELADLPEGAFAIAEVSLLDRKVTDDQLTHFADVPSLIAINLSYTETSDEGIKHLAGLKHLRDLRLARTKITDAAVALIAGLPELTTLELDQTAVTDAALEALKPAENLRRLTCSGTQISDAGLEHLAGLTKLRQLNLTGTKVTEAGLAKVQAALPDCKVLK